MVYVKFACDYEEKGERQNTEYRSQKTGGNREKTVNQGTGITGGGLSGQQGTRLCGYELFEKTKPIISYCVLRDAYCEKEFEKTKPIYGRPNEYKLLFDRGLCRKNRSRNPEKQTQFKLVLSVVEWSQFQIPHVSGNSDPDYAKQSQLSRIACCVPCAAKKEFGKTKPIWKTPDDYN
ncbi:MAG: hypothetical protein ACYSWW_16645 [Planctomycetota bacterium]|jgi:hypothetical protein